jgi:hypothetical protein
LGHSVSSRVVASSVSTAVGTCCPSSGICSNSLLRIPRCTDDLSAVDEATSSERENLYRRAHA